LQNNNQTQSIAYQQGIVIYCVWSYFYNNLNKYLFAHLLM